MKANELMIGDWVTVRRPNDRHEQVRVKSVIGNGTIEAKTSDGLVVFGELAVEPIPLTKEILEKNGFEKKIHYGIFDDYYDFELWEYSDGIWNTTYHNCEVSLPDEQVFISFVHELQHFLTHCGIEKEIGL